MALEGGTGAIERSWPAAEPYLNWGGIMVDVSEGVCVGSDC